AFDFVLDAADALDVGRRQFAHERAVEGVFLDEVMGDMPELRGEIFVDEENMHDQPCPSQSAAATAFQRAWIASNCDGASGSASVRPIACWSAMLTEVCKVSNAPH